MEYSVIINNFDNELDLFLKNIGKKINNSPNSTEEDMKLLDELSAKIEEIRMINSNLPFNVFYLAIYKKFSSMIDKEEIDKFKDETFLKTHVPEVFHNDIAPFLKIGIKYEKLLKTFLVKFNNICKNVPKGKIPDIDIISLFRSKSNTKK